MQTHQVLVGKSAEREICKLPADVQQLIIEALEGLGKNPRPPGCEKLKANPQFLRIRAGNYRILYAIRGRNIIVVVARDRKDAFKGLEDIDLKLAHALRRFASVMLYEASAQGRA